MLIPLRVLKYKQNQVELAPEHNEYRYAGFICTSRQTYYNGQSFESYLIDWEIHFCRSVTLEQSHIDSAYCKEQKIPNMFEFNRTNPRDAPNVIEK